jgi:hypothetical protein
MATVNPGIYSNILRAREKVKKEADHYRSLAKLTSVGLGVRNLVWVHEVVNYFLSYVTLLSYVILRSYLLDQRYIANYRTNILHSVLLVST